MRLVGVAIPVVWFALLFVAGAMRPGYDHVRQYMTELTTGPTESLILADFLLVGTLFVVFALQLRRAIPGDRAVVLIAALVAVKGIAIVATGLVHGDVDPLLRTPSGQLHNLLVAAGNIALAFGCLVALRVGALAGLRWYNAGTAIALVALIVALATLTTAGTGRADAVLASSGGLVQRISMLVGNLWPAVVAFALPLRPRSP